MTIISNSTILETAYTVGLTFTNQTAISLSTYLIKNFYGKFSIQKFRSTKMA